MSISEVLQEVGLYPDNSVVIGSSILGMLGIRESNDIDVIVELQTFKDLAKNDRFNTSQTHGREILVDEQLDIGTYWGVLGKNQYFADLLENSEIIDGVRFVTLEFLLAVKQSWLTDDDVRQKDIEDLRLMQDYLKSKT